MLEARGNVRSKVNLFRAKVAKVAKGSGKANIEYRNRTTDIERRTLKAPAGRVKIAPAF
jgi:hypothetical protein